MAGNAGVAIASVLDFASNGGQVNRADFSSFIFARRETLLPRRAVDIADNRRYVK